MTTSRARSLLWLSSSLLLACSSAESTPPDDALLRQGQAIYGEYCALCHGDEGEGYAADAANALSNQAFLALADDAFMRASIVRGRPGTPMSSWGAEVGGPLENDEVDALVAFIRSWQTSSDIDTSSIAVEGEALRGEAVYAVHCASCHGDDGHGGDFMSVANAEFLALADDGFLRTVIADGRDGTAMLAYGGELTPQNIDDVVTLIRSWAEPPGTLMCDAPQQDIAGRVVNPDGAAPAFGADLYVSVADVAAAYSGGSRMMMLDARPPCDYVEGHIAGAVSVPFFAVEEYLSQLSKDDTIVAYCACPHAESTAAANVLLDNGFSKVHVLDEGLPLWEEQAHPMTVGPEP